MNTLTIFVEVHPNPDLRTYHLSIPTTHKPFTRYDPKRPVPKKVKELERMLDCEPAVGLSISPIGHKYLSLERNKAYSWGDVTSAVVRVLKRYYPKGTEIIVKSDDPNPAASSNSTADLPLWVLYALNGSKFQAIKELRDQVSYGLLEGDRLPLQHAKLIVESVMQATAKIEPDLPSHISDIIAHGVGDLPSLGDILQEAIDTQRQSIQ